MRRHAPRVRLLFLVVLFVLGSGETAASGAEQNVATGSVVPVSLCRENPPYGDGTRRDAGSKVAKATGISGIPPRVAATVRPGTRDSICIAFANGMTQPLTLGLTSSDLAVDETGAPVSGVQDGDFGASSWLRMPVRTIRDLLPGQIAWLEVPLAVPEGASPGSWYAAVTASTRHAGPKGGTGVGSIGGVAIQILFTIPGETKVGGHVTEVRSPRLLWWDGLRLGRVPVLDKLRGLRIAPIRFTWVNDGSTSDAITGRIVIRSSLTGHVVERVDLPRSTQLVLRGSSRKFEATWADNIPLVGRFRPTIELTRHDGTKVNKELPAIWVIPSWWYVVGVLVAVVLPSWLWYRSRQRYWDLVARVDAAEGRNDVEYGDDYDDEFDHHP